MFPYTEKDTESESDIKNNNLLYTIHQQCQHTFEKSIIIYFDVRIPENEIRKKKTLKLATYSFCYIFKFHNSYFVIFIYLVLCIIYIYTCRSLTRVRLLHV